jgi:arsenite methyltransferase
MKKRTTKSSESDRLKKLVREKYGRIAKEAPAPGQAPAKRVAASSCCQSAKPSPCCAPAADPSASTYYSEDVAGIQQAYEKLEGHMDEADLGLGCGLPTEHAGLAPGQTVVDLGSGAGNDVFIARSVVGETGRVIGVDMTPEMIAKARANAARRGFKNVEFRLGDIEALPVDDASADVVVSNCVLNLVPDKKLAFAEIFRVLKPGGRFCVSDIVLKGELPAKLREVAELYVGCVAGALDKDDYLGVIRKTGFNAIEVKSSKKLDLPDEYLLPHIGAAALKAYRASGAAVLSITVVGRRPGR